MHNEDNKILKYNHGEKSMKAFFIIYPDLECLLEKIHPCQNNSKKSYTEKKLSVHILVTHCLQIVRFIQESCAQQSCTQQKTNLIVTEAKIKWKSFVNT